LTAAVGEATQQRQPERGPGRGFRHSCYLERVTPEKDHAAPRGRETLPAGQVVEHRLDVEVVEQIVVVQVTDEGLKPLRIVGIQAGNRSVVRFGIRQCIQHRLNVQVVHDPVKVEIAQLVPGRLGDVEGSMDEKKPQVFLSLAAVPHRRDRSWDRRDRMLLAP
jgi:hypothetical protein